MVNLLILIENAIVLVLKFTKNVHLFFLKYLYNTVSKNGVGQAFHPDNQKDNNR